MIHRTFKISAIAIGIVFFSNGLAFGAAESTSLSGEFLWENNDYTGKVEAVFEPTEPGQWNVAFHFKFRGKPHVYRGSAEGSLENGPLAGQVKNENGNRTFVFEGTSKQGHFDGTHEELTPGRNNEGTISFGPEASAAM